MGILSKLKTDTDIQSDGDSLGSRVLESDIYNFIIETNHVSVAPSGAMAVNFNFKNQSGKELKQTIYITSGNAKGNLNYYVDKSGNKKYLPGFTTVNDLCLVTAGVDISELETEEKVLSVWNPELGKEAPTKCQVIMDLIGKEVALAVVKVIEPKRVKDSSGAYVDSGETRTIYEISKVFRAEDMKTVTEISEESEAIFHTKWLEVNKGKDRIKKSSATAKSPTTTPSTPTKKLFS